MQLAYYDTTVTTDKGNAGDLKTITMQTLIGSTWTTTGTKYFRYYTSNSSVGFQGGLKYVVGPAPTLVYRVPTAPPMGRSRRWPVLAYQYDQTTRRVTQAQTAAGAVTYGITYTTSTNADGFNSWRTKATVTLPDGSTKIVYANHIGQDMLVDHQASSGRWIHFTQYDPDTSYVTSQYSPSAINMSGTPYDDSAANLNVQINGSSGLINVTTYYSDTDTAPNYPKEQQVQHGSGGTVANGGLITINKLEYEAHSVGSGATLATVYPVTKAHDLP